MTELNIMNPVFTLVIILAVEGTVNLLDFLFADIVPFYGPVKYLENVTPPLHHTINRRCRNYEFPIGKIRSKIYDKFNNSIYVSYNLIFNYFVLKWFKFIQLEFNIYEDYSMYLDDYLSHIYNKEYLTEIDINTYKIICFNKYQYKIDANVRTERALFFTTRYKIEMKRCFYQSLIIYLAENKYSYILYSFLILLTPIMYFPKYILLYNINLRKFCVQCSKIYPILK